ncbi:hypothetical protein AA0N74_11485 [Chromobacterium vaccinii]|uniref:hypothetical protein n=1 Tax=Chromobacterium vaccinii TaxID=1108595 RepID=UPI0031D113C8
MIWPLPWLAVLLSAASCADTPPASDIAVRPAAVFAKTRQAFERNQQLAPQAALRYRVFPARPAPFSLWQTGPAGKTRLPQSADAGFSAAALLDGYGVQAVSGRSGGFAWRPDIRTPGLPDNARRLGDLRLECLVDAQGGLNPGGEAELCEPGERKAACLDEVASCLRQASLVLLGQMEQMGQLQVEAGPYQNRPRHYLFIADQPLFSITLEHGDQKLVLPAIWQYGSAITTSPYAAWPYPREYLYSLPLESADWPDDTRVIFETMAKQP